MAYGAWIDVDVLIPRLNVYLAENQAEISRFGSTVNQTFEAFVIAQTVGWFQSQPGWTVEIVNPAARDGRIEFRLKFSTRGRPDNYTYVRCISPSGETFQIRHQLRVATRSHKHGDDPAANICLDVAVIKDLDLSKFKSDDFVPNADLITFGEAKHMSAFAELLASFIGLVHELQPERLRRIRLRRWLASSRQYPSPFLFVSGHLLYTAEGVAKTIARRKFDIDVFTKSNLLSSQVPLPGHPSGK